MPKILHRGRDPEKFVFVMRCSCGTVATFERSEVTSDQRDGDYVSCPICRATHATRRMERADPDAKPNAVYGRD
jgi:hypothetical protein